MTCWIFKALFLLSFFTPALVRAQDHDHEHDAHGHAHHRNELGMAHAPVLFLGEEGLAYGLHLHYIRSIKATRFGIGPGYERSSMITVTTPSAWWAATGPFRSCS